MSADSDALDLVDKFDIDGSISGVWAAIRKDEVVKGLRERIADKDGLNQHRIGLCAEAALVHTQLQDDPVAFVQLAIGFYKSGQAPWRGMIVRPNLALMVNAPPDGTIVNGTAQVFNRADWIVMASIRHTVNPADQFNRYSSQGTDMSDLEDFIRGVGYTMVKASYNSNSFSKDEDNAREASELLSRGYRVILNINAAMLYSESQSNWGDKIFPEPNHVVQLVSPIHMAPLAEVQDDPILPPELDDGPWWNVPQVTGVNYRGMANAVRFSVYTWAEGHRQVPQDPNQLLTLKAFLWNYYGYIAFKG